MAASVELVNVVLLACPVCKRSRGSLRLNVPVGREVSVVLLNAKRPTKRLCRCGGVTDIFLEPEDWDVEYRQLSMGDINTLPSQRLGDLLIHRYVSSKQKLKWGTSKIVIMKQKHINIIVSFFISFFLIS